MNPQLEAVALQIFAPDHKHSWCEFDNGVQCLECGEICQHKHIEAVVYETLASNGAFGYYEPPEEATKWHCVECGAIVPQPLKEPVTHDDDDGGLPF